MSSKTDEASEQKTSNNDSYGITGTEGNQVCFTHRISKHCNIYDLIRAGPEYLLVLRLGHNTKDEIDKFKALDNWLKVNGALYQRLELRDYGNEVRGCHAMEDIPEDEVIITIPLKCLITVEMGKDTDVSFMSEILK